MDWQPNQGNGTQLEMPFAMVQGASIDKMPQDLYIPPDALEVFLDAFEGPLDLLLYLIRRQNMDILNIQIAEVSRQYLAYISILDEVKLSLAAEYLLMAAMLAEIKSRMLLPVHEDEADEEDPRAELVRRLQEYERYKVATMRMDKLPRVGRDHFLVQVESDHCLPPKPLPDVSLKELLAALSEVISRVGHFTQHQVKREGLSVREKMSVLLVRLRSGERLTFTDLLMGEEGRLGVVVCFLAILELSRESMIELVQRELWAPIYVKVC